MEALLLTLLFAADVPPGEACQAKIKALDGEQTCTAEKTCTDEARACRFIATRVQQHQATNIRNQASAPSAALVQPSRPVAHGPSATTAQTDATPAVKPVGLAAASIGIAGQDAAAQALTTMSINPLGLGLIDDPEAFARWSRLTDLTLVLPASSVSSGTAPGFVGIRMSIDVLGPVRGAQLYRDAHQAFDDVLAAGGKLVTAVLELLDKSPTKSDCIEALLAPAYDDAKVKVACGASLVGQLQASARAETAFRDRVHELRRVADDGQLGLNLALNAPFTATDAMTRPFSMAAYAVYGARFGTGIWRTGFRLGAGADYIKPKGTDAAVGFNGAFNLEADAGHPALGEGEVHFSLGARCHLGDSLGEIGGGLTPIESGKYVDMQVGIDVPILSASGVTVTISWPAYRQNASHGPSLSLVLDGLITAALPPSLR